MTIRRLGFLPLIVALGAATACTDDSDGAGATDTGADDRSGDVSIDLTVDTGDADVADVFEPNEGEPNNIENPTNITVPARIRGTIGPSIGGELTGGEPDNDGFRFLAEAGQVVRLTIEDASIDPYIVLQLEDPDGAGFEMLRLLDSNTPGGTRQAFLPVEGSYLLTVDDGRNVEAIETGEGDLVGSDELTYQITVQFEDVFTDVAAMPLDDGGAELPEGNGVRILELTLDEPGIFWAFAGAPPEGYLYTELDASLVLLTPDYSEVLASNEASYEGGRDALIQTRLDPQTVRLIFDFYSAGETNGYALRARQLDQSVEAEPNDVLTSVWQTLPTDNAYDVTGTIGEPIERDNEDARPDVDWFDLGELSIGDSVLITARPTEGSEVVPRLFVGPVVPDGTEPEAILAQARPGPDNVARFELTAIDDAQHVVVVADDRNVLPDDAGDDDALVPVGGDDHRYVLSAAPFTRTEMDLGSVPVTLSGELAPGQVDWSIVETGSEGVLVAEVVGNAFDATIWALDRTAANGRAPVEIGQLMTRANRVLVVGGVLSARPLQLLVFNEGEWPEAGTVAYDLTIETLTLDIRLEAEVEGGDYGNAEANAEAVPPGGRIYEGALPAATAPGADHDVFTIRLGTGQRLVAETFGLVPEGSPEPGNADTILTLDGPGLDGPIESDDDDGVFSRVEYDVPEGGAGDYTLTVEPACDGNGCDDGAYGLRVVPVGGPAD